MDRPQTPHFSRLGHFHICDSGGLPPIALDPNAAAAFYQSGAPPLGTVTSPVLQTPPSTPGLCQRMPTPLPPPQQALLGPPPPQMQHLVGAPQPSMVHVFGPGGTERLEHFGMAAPHGAIPPPPPHHLIYSSPMGPHRIPPSLMGQPDFRIYEMNKRLQQRTEECDNLWWDAFATEFFEDDAFLTLSFMLEDGPKRYTIGRTLIPRFFRSIFEGGVIELYFVLRDARESFHNTSITVDTENAQMVTQHIKPMLTKVISEGRLILDFTFDDMMRIRSWHFQIRQHRELIMRSVLAMQSDPALLEQMGKNITRQGLTHHTLNFLRLCVILEPMQELMSRQKAFNLGPRECLKTTLFQKWQRMVAPPETNRQSSKRRKRKGSNADSGCSQGGGSGRSSAASKRNKSPGPPGPGGFGPGGVGGGPMSVGLNPPLGGGVAPPGLAQPGDVMIVGEPTLMGGDFGDEDERMIARLENTQYDPTPPPQQQLLGPPPPAQPPPHLQPPPTSQHLQPCSQAMLGQQPPPPPPHLSQAPLQQQPQPQPPQPPPPGPGLAHTPTSNVFVTGEPPDREGRASIPPLEAPSSQPPPAASGADATTELSAGLEESGPQGGGGGGGGGGAGVPDRGCLRTPDTPLARAESTPASQPGPPPGAEEAAGGLELGGGGGSGGGSGGGGGGGGGSGSPKREEVPAGSSEAAPTS